MFGSKKNTPPEPQKLYRVMVQFSREADRPSHTEVYDNVVSTKRHTHELEIVTVSGIHFFIESNSYTTYWIVEL